MIIIIFSISCTCDTRTTTKSITMFNAIYTPQFELDIHASLGQSGIPPIAIPHSHPFPLHQLTLCTYSISIMYNLPPPHQSNWVHQSYSSPLQLAGSYSLSLAYTSSSSGKHLQLLPVNSACISFPLSQSPSIFQLQFYTEQCPLSTWPGFTCAPCWAHMHSWLGVHSRTETS